MTLPTGSKKNDWYKIKLNKKKKVVIKVTYKNFTGAADFTVYNKKGKKVLTYGKLKKGTYYVKISRNSPKASGQYKFKWK